MSAWTCYHGPWFVYKHGCVTCPYSLSLQINYNALSGGREKHKQVRLGFETLLQSLLNKK